jgi:hypothetical protein
LEQEYQFAKVPDVVAPVVRGVEEKEMGMALRQVPDSIVSNAVTVTPSTGNVQEATMSIELPEEATTGSAVEDNEAKPASEVVTSPISTVKSEQDESRLTILEPDNVAISDQPYTEILDNVAATVFDAVSPSTNTRDASTIETLQAESHVASEPPSTTELASTGISLTSTTASPASAVETTVTEKKVVRVVETVTETEIVRVSVTSTESVTPVAATTVPSVGSDAHETLVFELGGPYRLPENDLASDGEILGPLALCGEIFC